MALINCSTCGRQISDRASVCPYCGQPAANYIPPQTPAQHTAAPVMQPAPAAKSKTPLIIAVTVVLVALIAGAVVLIINLNKSGGKNNAGNDSEDLPAANSMLVISGAESGDSCTLHLKVQVESNILMANYMVDVYLDGTKLASLDDTTTYDQEMTVLKGAHTITFKNNEQPDNAKYTCEVIETLTGDTGISYSLKRNTEKGGVIDKVTGIEIRDRKYF